jgi:basic membrane protein A
MKKGLAVAVVALLSLAGTACGGKTSEGASASGAASSAAPALKAGLISVGDETETYSKAHIDGFNAAAAKLGIAQSQLNIQVNVPESNQVTTVGNDMIDQGCNLIFTNSYGHQDFAYQLAKNNPEVTVVADTGDYAALTGLSNFKNAFTDIYEARYVSGLVGGLKLKELVDNGELGEKNKDASGNWKIGYVGAFKYAEVISGYSAFYIGILDGFGASNVTMEIQFTSSWFDHDAEKVTAQTLIDRGCAIIGQHADSTGAPEACEESFLKGTKCFSIGYNLDMLSAAPHAALTSSTNVWEVFYEYALGAKLNGTEFATDWAKGYKDGAVAITTLGPNVAAGTAEKVKEAEDAIKAGSLKVFDTSKFTVGGQHITSNKVDFSYYTYDASGAHLVHQGPTEETVKSEGGVTYVEESVKRSAPYFSLSIDGITWLN